MHTPPAGRGLVPGHDDRRLRCRGSIRGDVSYLAALTVVAILAAALVVLHQELLDSPAFEFGGEHWFPSATAVLPGREVLRRVLVGVVVPWLVLWGLAVLVYRMPFDVWIWIVAALTGVAVTASPLLNVHQLNTHDPTREEVFAAGLDRFADHEDVRLVVVETADVGLINGYTIGGPFADVVGLSRYAIESLPPAQAQAAFAHELGHHRLGHTLVRGATSVGVMILGAAVLSTLFSALTPVSTLAFLVLVGTERAAGTAVTRWSEYRADEFAARHTSPAAMLDLLRSLRAARGVDETTVPWWATLFSTHPTYTRRIAHVERTFPESESADGTPRAAE